MQLAAELGLNVLERLYFVQKAVMVFFMNEHARHAEVVTPVIYYTVRAVVERNSALYVSWVVDQS